MEFTVQKYEEDGEEKMYAVNVTGPDGTPCPGGRSKGVVTVWDEKESDFGFILGADGMGEVVLRKRDILCGTVKVGQSVEYDAYQQTRGKGYWKAAMVTLPGVSPAGPQVENQVPDSNPLLEVGMEEAYEPTDSVREVEDSKQEKVVPTPGKSTGVVLRWYELFFFLRACNIHLVTYYH